MLLVTSFGLDIGSEVGCDDGGGGVDGGVCKDLLGAMVL